MALANRHTRSESVLVRRKRTFFHEFLLDELRNNAPSLSAYEEMQRMFYHQQFAEERLRSASYFFGTGFSELTDDLLDAAEMNLDEAEQMLERLPGLVQLTVI